MKPPPADIFATTRWTLVLEAGAGLEATQAWETLCGTYWMPLHGYVRRQGFSAEDAEDLTQGFLATLLQRSDFAGLDRTHGRFRAFLLASLKHYLANQRARSAARKRGGGTVHLSFDRDLMECGLQPSDPACGPDEAYDRDWALTLLPRVLGRLREESEADGGAARFEVLRTYLDLHCEEIPYAEAARRLAVTEGAVRVAVHRLRKRYRALLRDEIGRTLADPAMVEDELKVLAQAFA